MTIAIEIIFSIVIPGLGPGIHEFAHARRDLRDARAKPGHDDPVLGAP